MKKILSATFASAIALVLLSTAVAAQSNHLATAARSTSKEVSTDPSELEAKGSEAPATAINARLTRSFSKSFAAVTPKWYQVDDKFLARFTENGNFTHALYHKNGFQYYSVTKGNPGMLPNQVRQMMEENYPDYTIAAATKVVSVGTTAWIADLTLGSKLLIVKVIGNEITESAHYQNKIK